MLEICSYVALTVWYVPEQLFPSLFIYFFFFFYCLCNLPVWNRDDGTNTKQELSQDSVAHLNRALPLKTLTKNFDINFSKSLTLTLRSLMGQDGAA